jgi:hypothetical protein
LAEYEEALETLETLQMGLRTHIGKINTQHWIGYVCALRQYNMLVELDKPIQIDIPDEEYTVDSQEQILMNNSSSGKTLTNPQTEALMIFLEKKFTIVEYQNDIHAHYLEEIKQDTKTILEEIHFPVPDRVKEKLIGDYGDWINQLEDSNDIFNGEYLSESLSQRAWNGVVACYSITLEAELKKRLVNSLKQYLIPQIILPQGKQEIHISNGESISINDNNLTIGTMQKLIKWALVSPLLKNFWSRYPLDTIKFIATLPEPNQDLDNFRKIRNDADHFKERLPKDKADTARDLLLGKNKNSGLLKRIHDIKTVN